MKTYSARRFFTVGLIFLGIGYLLGFAVYHDPLKIFVDKDPQPGALAVATSIVDNRDAEWQAKWDAHEKEWMQRENDWLRAQKEWVNGNTELGKQNQLILSDNEALKKELTLSKSALVGLTNFKELINQFVEYIYFSDTGTRKNIQNIVFDDLQKEYVRKETLALVKVLCQNMPNPKPDSCLALPNQ